MKDLLVAAGGSIASGPSVDPITCRYLGAYTHRVAISNHRSLRTVSHSAGETPPIITKSAF
jgi:hypothetical protein